MEISNTTDSLLFDMDGTLWDATDSYAAVWNHCFDSHNVDIHITGADLVPYMGKPIEMIVEGITRQRVDTVFNPDKFVEALGVAEDEMMPRLGGKLYPGVYDCLRELSQHYRLFMVSNCGLNGLHTFMQFTHTEQFFTGSVSYGERPVPKSDNMRYLIDTYKLRNAVYVGDTQGDCDQTHRAGLPFVFAQYGFGNCQDYDLAFDNFADLTDFFIKLKQHTHLL